MQLSLLIFLVSFSIKSTIPSPVGDQNDATFFGKPLIDISEEPTEQPGLNTDESQSPSQLLAINSKSETPALNPIENFMETLPGDSSSISSVNLGTSKSALV